LNSELENNRKILSRQPEKNQSMCTEAYEVHSLLCIYNFSISHKINATVINLHHYHPLINKTESHNKIHYLFL